MRTALLAAVAVAGLQGGAACAARTALHLDAVVVVMRHGVRPPTSAQPLPVEVSPDPWPQWSVPPGWLTPHGAQEVSALAREDRALLIRAGLLPARGCPAADRVRIVADGGDQRTVATGEAYADGLAHGCGLVQEHSPVIGQPDPLYSPLSAGRITLNPARADAAAAAAFNEPGTRALMAQAGPLVARLNAILCGDRVSGCGLDVKAPVKLRGATDRKGPALSGAPGAGSSAAQSLLLEYAEGKPMAEVGWGRATTADITSLSALHALKFRITERPAYLAGKTLSGLAPLVGQALKKPGQVLVLGGHDSTVAAFGGLLGVHWQVEGFAPDDIPPGGALLLQSLSDGAGHRYVRAVFRSFSLEGIRAVGSAAAGLRAIYTPVAIEGCGAGRRPGLCTLAQVEAKLARAGA